MDRKEFGDLKWANRKASVRVYPKFSVRDRPLDTTPEAIRVKFGHKERWFLRKAADPDMGADAWAAAHELFRQLRIPGPTRERALRTMRTVR